jgi:N6-adenosine-specific RNA methylase IME4
VSGKYRTIVADPPWEHEGTGVTFRDEGATVTGLPYGTMMVDEIAALPVGEMAAPEAHLYLWTTAQFLPDTFRILHAWGFSYAAPLVWCKPPRGFGMGGQFQSNVEFVLFGRRLGADGHLAITTFLADAADRTGISRREVDLHMGTSDMAGWWLSRLEYRSRIPKPDQWAKLKAFLGAGNEMDEEYERLRNAEKWEGAKINTRWFEWPRGAHSAKPDAFLDMVEQVSPAPRVELFARRDRLGWDTWGNESLGTAEMPEAA